MRTYLADTLRLGGFNVEMAGDGLAALRSVERHRPDAVVLDLDLPLMNGVAVHAAWQSDERTRDLPIVIVTGTGLTGPSPVAARLVKPILPDDLVQVVFDALTGVPPSNTPEETRTILWLCPQCGRVSRETSERGHPMTSEMRTDLTLCTKCRDGVV